MNGNWQQVTLDTPLHLRAGDVTVVVANSLQVWRDGVLIETRTLTPGPIVEPNPVASARTITELFYFKETKMPGINVALTGVTVGGSGSVTASFSDGENTEFASWEDLKASCVDIDTDGATARKMLLALTVARSPDGADKTNMVGGSCAINTLAQTPAVVTYPE